MTSTSPTPSDERVLLIVDDSRFARLSLKTMIEGLRPGWRVMEADSAEAALKFLDDNTPDCVSVDLNMPAVNGFELLEQLRPRLPNCPMVMLTANVQKSTRVRAEEMGVRCVNKPITDESVRELLEGLAA